MGRFHGGPGLDNTMFGDHLDPLTEEGRYRLVLVDDRACGRSDRMRDTEIQTEDEAAELLADQMPFHFQEPRGAAFGEYLRRTAGLDATGPTFSAIPPPGTAAWSTSKTGSQGYRIRCWYS